MAARQPELMSAVECEEAINSSLFSTFEFSIAAAAACVVCAKFLPGRYRYLPIVPLGLAGTIGDWYTGQARAEPYKLRLAELKRASVVAAAAQQK